MALKKKEELLKRVEVLKLIESILTPSLLELFEKLSDTNLDVV